MLAIELGHALVFLLLELLVASALLFFARRFGDAHLVEIVLQAVPDVGFVQNQRVIGSGQTDLMATGEDLMPAMFVIPLGEGRGHVHLFDDVPPAYTGVVRTEGDLTFLSGVGDDALLGAPEIVVEEILEPHAGDEEKIPAVGATPIDIGARTVRGDFAIALTAHTETLVEFRDQITELEMPWRVEWIVVAEQSQSDSQDGELAAACAIVDGGHILCKPVGVQEGRHRNRFLGFLVAHHRHADPTIRVAATGELTPIRIWPVYQVGEVGTRAHERDGEPVAGRNAKAGLRLYVVGEV